MLAMAGPVVSVLVSALEGAIVVGGLSALGCAMLELGIDHSSAIKYEVALKADQFILMVHGSEAEIQHARSMLDGPKKQLAYEHQLPDELSK